MGLCQVRLFAKLGGVAPAAAQFCWRLTSIFLAEDAHGCWPVGEVRGVRTAEHWGIASLFQTRFLSLLS
jgi:hypothetical protein